MVSGLNQMYMSGGEYPDGSASKAVWRYDPRINVWQEMASMNTPRSELGTYEYVVGPCTTIPPLLRTFSPVVSNEMNPCLTVGLALLDGFIYAVGGWEGSSRLDSVERYEVETNTWSHVTNMRMAVTSPAVVTYQGNRQTDQKAKSRYRNGGGGTTCMHT